LVVNTPLILKVLPVLTKKNSYKRKASIKRCYLYNERFSDIPTWTIHAKEITPLPSLNSLIKYFEKKYHLEVIKILF